MDRLHCTLHLEPINGVNFTKREIDVIACILSGKPVKKIAQFLSISPRTVENHVHNIMLKLGCQSQEKIIEFVEKSDKFLLIRKHYLNLLIQSSFTSELKAISTLIANNNYACLFIISGNPEGNTTFVRQFINDLQLAGVKVSSEYDGKKDLNVSQDHKLEFTHVIYMLTSVFLDKLEKLQTDNLNEYNETIKNINSIKSDKNLCTPALFVIVESQSFKDFLKESLSLECLSFDDQENYYFFIFEALKRLLPNLDVDKKILSFRKKCRAFHDENSKDSPSKDSRLFKLNVNTLINAITKSKMV